MTFPKARSGAFLVFAILPWAFFLMLCSRLQASTGNKFWADQKMPIIHKSWKDIENAPWTLVGEFSMRCVETTNIDALRFLCSSCWQLLTHTVHCHLPVAHPPQGLESLYKAICARYNAEEAKEPQELPETRRVAERAVRFSWLKWWIVSRIYVWVS